LKETDKTHFEELNFFSEQSRKCCGYDHFDIWLTDWTAICCSYYML